MGGQPHLHARARTHRDEVRGRRRGRWQPPQARREGVGREHGGARTGPPGSPIRREATRREQQRAEDDNPDPRSPDLGGDQADGTRGEGVFHHDATASLELLAQERPHAGMVR